jgi:hypothetical protein
MARLITGLEVHRYAPEFNKLHLRNRQIGAMGRPMQTTRDVTSCPYRSCLLRQFR